MSKPEEQNRLYLAFVECERRGRWSEYKQSPPRNQYAVWSSYQAMKEPDCQIWIVEPDGLRRGFAIKNDAIISIGPNIVQFNKDEAEEIASVDEESQRTGKKPRAML